MFFFSFYQKHPEKEKSKSEIHYELKHDIPSARALSTRCTVTRQVPCKNTENVDEELKGNPNPWTQKSHSANLY